MSLSRIMPTPGFICKCLRSSGGSKVFLNICGSNAVEYPQGISGETIAESWLEATPSIDNLQIPIAVGAPQSVGTPQSVA